MTSLQFTEGPHIPEPFSKRKQLLNHVVDGLAQARPFGVWAEIPNSATSYEAGFRRVTYRDLSNAINGIAWWLCNALGKGSRFKTLAYIGLWDVRYVILLLGAVKAGYKVLRLQMVFPSPKYSLAGLEKLLGELDCKVLLTIPEAPPVVSAFLKAHKAPELSVPTVHDLLDAEFSFFPLDKTFSTARKEPLVSLHTSGSTSHPKPIVWTHDYAASFIQQHQYEPPPGFDSVDKLYQGNRLVPMLPAFHAGNLFSTLLIAIASQTTVIYPLPNANVSAETLVQILQHTTADVAVGSPNVIEQLARNLDMRQIVFRKIRALGYAGGDISRSAGDILAKEATLFSVYASTENGVTPTIRPKKPMEVDDWKCIEPHPNSGFHFRHLANSEYEAVVVRNSIEDEEQPVFKLFPNLREWPTKDIFTPDPLNPRSWIYRSRTDDLLVFSDGTTFNPLDFEQQISGHPEIKAALMFGTRRPQAALLMELENPQGLSGDAHSELMERLWPTIAEANRMCTAQSVIQKSHILLAQAENPLPRAGKGTVQRARAFQMYEAALGSLYL